MMTNVSDDNTPDSTADPKSDAPRRFPFSFHPICFAIYPLLLLYSKNLNQIGITELVKPVVYSLLGTLFIWLLFGLLSRQERKGAAAASAGIVLIFFYGHFQTLVSGSMHWIAGPLCISIWAGLCIIIFRTHRALREITKFLNFISFVLLLPSVWAIVTYKPDLTQIATSPTIVSNDTHVAKLTNTRKIANLTKEQADRLPDIYYIILDAYGRQDRLQEYYGYDNRSFITALENRGFYVAKKSTANYNQTPLCLASSLNFDYLDEKVDKKLSSGNALEKCRELLDSNEVARILSTKGYKYVHIGSGNGEVQVDTADVDLNDEVDENSFQNEAMGLTPIRSASAEKLSYDQHRSKLMGVFDKLETVVSLPGPKFVYAHVLAPHPPFVFDPTGEPVNPKGPMTYADGSWLLNNITREEYMKAYIDQLKYVNKRTLQAVSKLQGNSQHTPIIIIQGDHGSRMNLDWDAVEKTDVREVFSILNAYYVPGKVRARLYETISPVNSFRILLSTLFDRNLPLISDKSYYSASMTPVEFVDVTSQTISQRHK